MVFKYHIVLMSSFNYICYELDENDEQHEPYQKSEVVVGVEPKCRIKDLQSEIPHYYSLLDANIDTPLMFAPVVKG
jgi:hypothetical protein